MSIKSIFSATGARSAGCNRRDFLAQFGCGLGGIALASLLSRDGLLASESAVPFPGCHHVPRARRVIQIFLPGGLSHIDSMDYKPQLDRSHGKSLQGEKPEAFFNSVGLLHRSHFPFKQYGQSGEWISSMFPRLGQVADELTFIRSMVAESGNHVPAIYQANSGFRTMGFPALGAWLSYGLGNLSDSLPTFVVMPDPRGIYTGGANYWGSGFLPAEHQGVSLRATGPIVNDLQSAAPVEAKAARVRLDFLEQMNRRHLESHPAASDALAARIRSYELAARMQSTIPEAAGIESESKETRELYGVDDPECAEFARRALLARRLIERGVRFVQLWSGGETGAPIWDAHDNVPLNQGGEAKRIDRPLAGLIRDLRQRGLFDDTLLLFNTEFGRTPFAQAANGQLGTGRDHNQTGFTVFLAGAGLKRGYSYGATDELGYKAVVNPVTVYDYHATILHLLGIDHERLTFYHDGMRRRLTNVSGRVIRDLMA